MLRRPFFRRTDWLAVGGILLAAVAIWFGLYIWHSPEKTGLTAEISVDNQIWKMIPFPAENGKILIPGKRVVLQIEDNTIRFLETDCPDKTCQRSGRLGAAGQTAVCLPNRIVVRMVDGEQSAIDGITE